MFVNISNLSSSLLYVHPLAPPSRFQQIAKVLTYLAVVALLIGAAYLVVRDYWKNRHVRQQDPAKIIPPAIVSAPLDQKAGSANTDKNDAQQPQPVVPPSANLDPVKRNQPAIEPLKSEHVKPDQHPVAKKEESKPENLDAQLDETKKNDRSKETKREEIASDLNPLKEDISLDIDLTIEENIHKNLAGYLAQEKNKYSYGGMFYRYEGVYAALKAFQKKGQSEYVNFCNPAFIKHFEKMKDRPSQWDLNISIDPSQRDGAWKIIWDEVESTSLAMQGMIHSSDKCEAGKEIVLQFLVSDHDKQNEIRQFLTLLAHQLSAAGIRVDHRALSQEPLLGIIPCQGVPSYFTYGTETFTVVQDDVWDELLADRTQIEKIVEGKVIKLDDDPKIWIKASHYRTLGNARVNPFAIANPFEKLTISRM